MLQSKNKVKLEFVEIILVTSFNMNDLSRGLRLTISTRFKINDVYEV